jgi:hypothetical protein
LTRLETTGILVEMMESAHSARRLSALRTLKFAVRESWDALGLLCAVSLTLFLAAACPIFFFLRSIPLGAAAFCLISSPLFAGACWLAQRVYDHDEPTYMDLWVGLRIVYFRAVLVGVVQAAVFGALAFYIAFYSSHSGFGFLLLSFLMWYCAGFWAMNCIYHYPLLIASEQGIVRQDNGEPMRMRAVFRNGFVLSISAPLYSLALVVGLVAITVPLVFSAVGLALVGAFPAFLCMRAARDQFIHHGLIDPDPDPDDPVSDEVWKMRG